MTASRRGRHVAPVAILAQVLLAGTWALLLAPLVLVALMRRALTGR